MQVLKAAWVLLLASTCMIAPGQSTSAPAPEARPKKTLTPEQARFQKAAKQWNERRDALRAEAKKALEAEQAREKTGDCPQADTTLSQEECLAKEAETTRMNYAAFTAAVRSMLADDYPKFPGEKPEVGPTGAPLAGAQLVMEFDALEAASASYRKQATQAAYDQFRGGTLAPVFQIEAEQKLLRSHLAELNFLYGEELSDH